MNDALDLIVVGGGPGGYVAAIRAAQLGFRTALVERSELGGTCLNWGCIPTKALLRGADVAHTLRHAGVFGFTTGEVGFDIATLVGHSRRTAARLSTGVSGLMARNGVRVIRGDAKIAGKCVVAVTGEGGQTITLSAPHVLLATGARPRTLPGLVVDGIRIWGAREAMTPRALPRRLLVIGSGAIGMEFASLYADLGSEVTVVEVLDRVLPGEDDEISAAALKAFVRRGIAVRTSTSVASMRPGADAVYVEFQSAAGGVPPSSFDNVIVATGVTGNIEGLGLESLGVQMEKGYIKVDPYGRTNVVGLYAIGDVVGAPCLAHKASHEAVICVEKIAGQSPHPLIRDNVPRCTYSRPQVASTGLTERAARATGREISVGRFAYKANGKALAMDDSDGFVKVVLDAKRGEILGAHMIGPEVTEQIQGFGVAQTLEATAEDLVATVFAHPTLSECMHEAVLDAANRALHK